jgi:hypothetical protein
MKKGRAEMNRCRPAKLARAEGPLCSGRWMEKKSPTWGSRAHPPLWRESRVERSAPRSAFDASHKIRNKLMLNLGIWFKEAEPGVAHYTGLSSHRQGEGRERAFLGRSLARAELTLFPVLFSRHGECRHPTYWIIDDRPLATQSMVNLLPRKT